MPTQTPTVVVSLKTAAHEPTATEVSSKLIGGIIGGILGLTCLVFICIFFIRRHRQKSNPRPPANPPDETGGLLAAPQVGSSSGGCGGGGNNGHDKGSGSASDPSLYDSRTPKSNAPYSAMSSCSRSSPQLRAGSLPSQAVLPTVFRKGMRLYTVVEVLGKGNFGTAYLVTDPKMDQYVVKTILSNDQNEAIKEAKTLALNSLSSPHLMTISDFFFEAEQLFCVVLNYCRGGSLLDLISQQLDASEVERILREIADGLCCLHDSGIVHRDLKPDNVFLLDPQSRLVVIGDMGMAREVNENGYYEHTFGHNLYKAPEIVDGKFSPRSDMWAVGCIGLELLSGESMAHRYHANRLILGRSTPKELSQVLDSLPAHTKEHNAFKMIANLLVIEPRDRLTAHQLRVFPTELPPKLESPPPPLTIHVDNREPAKFYYE